MKVPVSAHLESFEETGNLRKCRVVTVNHVEKAAGETETANIFEYSYEKESENGEKKEARFCWVTSMELTKKNNQISTDIYIRIYHVMAVWITFLKNQRNVFTYQ